MISWTAKSIETWAGRWATKRPLAAAFSVDIGNLARRYVAAPLDTPEAAVCWHHLLMGVGNFKRQAPIFPASLPSIASEPNKISVPDRLPIPEQGGTTLVRDDPSTWSVLTSIHGIRTATATAVLAALWPDDHLILDEVVLHIAGALRAERDDSYLDKYLDITESPYSEPNWDVYTEVRPWFVSIAESNPGATLWKVEKASFALSAALETDTDRTWRKYIKALNQKLTQAAG
jgi:hypothetical protein